MSTQNVVLLVVVIAILYVPARIKAHMSLQKYLKGMQSVIDRMETIYAVAGHTRGKIQEAGKEDEHDRLWAEGGKYYRKAVREAAFLLYWPIGVSFFQLRMLRAYDTVGLFAGSRGSYQAYEDVRKGFAEDTDYYPCNHLKGLKAALSVAPLFI